MGDCGGSVLWSCYSELLHALCFMYNCDYVGYVVSLMGSHCVREFRMILT